MTPALMEKHADAAITLKTGYQIEILSERIIAIFKDDKLAFYNAIANDKMFFESTQYADPLIIKAGTYKQEMRGQDELGRLIAFPNELKFGVWICMLNVALKRQFEEKCREHFTKRMQAICDISKITHFKLSMSSVTLVEAHDHVRKYFEYFVKPIFIGHFNERLTPVIDYIRTMLSGYEMSGS